MTTLTIHRFGFERTSRGVRTLEFARRLAEDELAGRDVWCMAALPPGRAAASRLSDTLDGVNGARATQLDLAVDERVRQLARRLDAELAGGAVPRPLQPDEQELLAALALAAERLVDRRVRPGDIVVLHDTPTAVLALTLREHGAHPVWRVRSGPAPAALLGRLTGGLDAYVTNRPGRMVALMPASSAVAAKEVPIGGGLDGTGWGSLLGDVVHGDRSEHVGGTRHVHPAVAAR
ncbi:MAG: hypothetical protein JWP17_4035 [Solirubrobacterales bacterium]|nr:hypothetical protein [Solirubrobacterales bacterium]